MKRIFEVAKTFLLLVLIPTGPSALAQSKTTSVAEELEAFVLELESDPSPTIAKSDLEVVVKTEATPTSAVDPTATGTTLSNEQLERSRARGTDAATLIDTVAGARVLDLGGPLGDRRLTLRGGSPAQSLVLVDGIPLRAPFANGIDLGFVDLESTTSMQVIRGGAGAVYGDGALTGALIINTSGKNKRPREAASISFGSFETAKISAVAAEGPVTISGGYERTSGDFEYTSKPFGLPAQDRTRHNNDAERGRLSLRVREGDFDLVAAGSLRRAGVPGLEGFEQDVAREARDEAHTRFAWLKKINSGLLGASASAAYLNLDYENKDQSDFARTRFLSLTADASGELTLLESHRARLFGSIGGELADARFSADAAGTDETVQRPERMRASIALSDEAYIGDFTLFLAGRIDTVTDQKPALLPRAGLRYDATEDLAFTLAAGRSQRAPTVDELYRPTRGNLSGNENLVPETSWEAELSLSFRRERFAFGLATFARAIENTILYLNLNAHQIRPENVGTDEAPWARALGGELEGRYQEKILGIDLSLDASFSLLFSQLDLTEEPLPTQPRWSTATEIAMTRGPVTLGSVLRAFGPTTTKLRAEEINSVPTYLRWDAGIDVEPLEGVTCTFWLLNLLDDRTLQSVHGIPLPGRTFLMSARVSSSVGEAP